ncbi:MAG: SapC family protein, partial [Kiloniellaceae bacterium]
ARTGAAMQDHERDRDEDQAATPGKNGTGTAPAPPPPPAPLFYADPRPLNPAVHGDKGLRRPPTCHFAAGAHAVVLHAQEFRLAAACYPIVFSDDESAMPLAVLGYREARNVFVDEAGQWAEGTYVPAYVRRYPFASGEGPKSGEMLLYVDAASDLIVDMESNPDAEPLFADGQPAEATKRALEFCAAFQRQVPDTRAFVDAVIGHELIQPKEIRLELPGGGNQLLTGLRLIDEARFNALPDQVFLDWRRRGWVALVYWHWASMDNFRRLLDRG